jgi:hypothetical protein
MLKKACKVGFVGVLLAIVPADKGVAWADEANVAQSNPSPKNAGYAGKVIVLDRAQKTVTVEIQQRLYLLKLGSDATILQKGKKVSPNHLLPGQEVTVELTSTATGDVQIASVTIGTTRNESEATGSKSRN